jgi:all-trans-nonaprenyl-diphosphate synthase
MQAISATQTLEQILAPVREEISTLDDRIINRISPDSGALCSILQDIFKAGGKRLRPALSFLSFKAILAKRGLAEPSSELLEKIFLVAEISELIHTASLVHDDIIDNSFVRRGKPTANSKWDNAVTVISGDFMFARAAVNLGKLGSTEIVSIYAAVLEALCDGEIQQVEKKYNTDLDFDYYFSKSWKKTASLFEASTKSPSVLLGSAAMENNLADYGKFLGLAFQIIDDILDYSSNEQILGKPIGSDIKEGQLTLPLLYTLEELSKSSPGLHLSLVNKIQALAADNLRQDIVDDIIFDVKKYQGIEKSFAKAKDFIDQAISSLDCLADSIYKQSMIDLACFVLKRNH